MQYRAVCADGLIRRGHGRTSVRIVAASLPLVLRSNSSCALLCCTVHAISRFLALLGHGHHSRLRNFSIFVNFLFFPNEP